MPPRNSTQCPGSANNPLRIRRGRLRIGHARDLIQYESHRHSFDRPAAARHHLYRDRVRNPSSHRRPLSVSAQQSQRRRHRIDFDRELRDHVVVRRGEDRVTDRRPHHVPDAVDRRDRGVGGAPLGLETQDPLPPRIGHIGHRLASLAFRHPQARITHDPYLGRKLPDHHLRLRRLVADRHHDDGSPRAASHYGSSAVYRRHDRISAAPDRRHTHQGIAVRVGGRNRQVDRVANRRRGVERRRHAYPAHRRQSATNRHRIRVELRLDRVRVRENRNQSRSSRDHTRTPSPGVADQAMRAQDGSQIWLWSGHRSGLTPSGHRAVLSPLQPSRHRRRFWEPAAAVTLPTKTTQLRPGRARWVAFARQPLSVAANI